MGSDSLPLLIEAQTAAEGSTNHENRQFTIFTSITPKHHELRSTNDKLNVRQSRMLFGIVGDAFVGITLGFRHTDGYYRVDGVVRQARFIFLALLRSCVY